MCATSIFKHIHIDIFIRYRLYFDIIKIVSYVFRVDKFCKGEVKIRVPFHSREIVLGDINSPRDFCQTMPEDRAWRIPRVLPDISESLIIHFMEITPSGKARSEDTARGAIGCRDRRRGEETAYFPRNLARPISSQ